MSTTLRFSSFEELSKKADEYKFDPQRAVGFAKSAQELIDKGNASHKISDEESTYFYFIRATSIYTKLLTDKDVRKTTQLTASLNELKAHIIKCMDILEKIKPMLAKKYAEKRETQTSSILEDLESSGELKLPEIPKNTKLDKSIGSGSPKTSNKSQSLDDKLKALLPHAKDLSLDAQPSSLPVQEPLQPIVKPPDLVQVNGGVLIPEVLHPTIAPPSGNRPGADDAAPSHSHSSSLPLSPLSYSELFKMLNEPSTCDKVLIVDIRSLKQFRESHIQLNLTAAKLVNIPPELLSPGVGASNIQKALLPRHQKLFEQRSAFQALVLITATQSTEEEHYLSIFLEAILQYGGSVEVKSENIKILSGGFAEWYLRYPSLASGPLSKGPNRAKESTPHDNFLTKSYPTMVDIDPTYREPTPPPPPPSAPHVLEPQNFTFAPVPSPAFDHHVFDSPQPVLVDLSAPLPPGDGLHFVVPPQPVPPHEPLVSIDVDGVLTPSLNPPLNPSHQFEPVDNVVGREHQEKDPQEALIQIQQQQQLQEQQKLLFEAQMQKMRDQQLREMEEKEVFRQQQLKELEEAQKIQREHVLREAELKEKSILEALKEQEKRELALREALRKEQEMRDLQFQEQERKRESQEKELEQLKEQLKQQQAHQQEKDLHILELQKLKELSAAREKLLLEEKAKEQRLRQERASELEQQDRLLKEQQRQLSALQEQKQNDQKALEMQLQAQQAYFLEQQQKLQQDQERQRREYADLLARQNTMTAIRSPQIAVPNRPAPGLSTIPPFNPAHQGPLNRQAPVPLPQTNPQPPVAPLSVPHRAVPHIPQPQRTAPLPQSISSVPSSLSKRAPAPGVPAMPNIDRSSKPKSDAFSGRLSVAFKKARLESMEPVEGSPGPVLTGLKNLGNTCFMNTVIQCLSNTAPLAAYFVQGRYRADINRVNVLGTKGELAEEFGELVRVLWCGNFRSVAPKFLKSSVEKFAPRFIGSEQQDCQEFCQYLLDGLHEDLNRSITKEYKPDPEGVRDEAVRAKLSWDNHLRLNNSVMIDFFMGQLKVVNTCNTCGNSSTKFDPFLFLTLSLPSNSPAPVSLSDLLALFCSKQPSDWLCPKCSRQKSTQQIFIYKMPPLLMISLKRFWFQGPFRNKIQTLVYYPMTLDSQHYVTGPSKGPTYQLYGVANHFGTLSGGHYIAYCKNPYSNRWFQYDDSVVSPIPESKVCSASGYMLFYTSVDFSHTLPSFSS